EKISSLFTLITLLIRDRLATKQNTGAEISVNFFNQKMTSYDYSTLYYLYKEIFCSDEYFFKTSTNQPIIIDCGANIGAATLYFKKLYPKSKIIAFEANPQAYSLFKKNMELNNIIDVEAHNVALFDQETNLDFFINENTGIMTGSIRKERGGAKQIKIQ